MILHNAYMPNDFKSINQTCQIHIMSQNVTAKMPLTVQDQVKVLPYKNDTVHAVF